MKQRLHYAFQKKIETMDRVAIIQEENIVQSTLKFSVSTKD